MVCCVGGFVVGGGATVVGTVVGTAGSFVELIPTGALGSLGSALPPALQPQSQAFIDEPRIAQKERQGLP